MAFSTVATGTLRMLHRAYSRTASKRFLLKPFQRINMVFDSHWMCSSSFDLVSPPFLEVADVISQHPIESSASPAPSRDVAFSFVHYSAFVASLSSPTRAASVCMHHMYPQTRLTSKDEYADVSSSCAARCSGMRPACRSWPQLQIHRLHGACDCARWLCWSRCPRCSLAIS